ncbi:hypothetical protein NHX12_013328 [Muraenolepis orangiensis]|uniref:Uncharacterized protein n=1 Tax=Muraenolepis orangiensis TaxID=630683 RepID=A0A9Q0DHY3_9TELE|nr:hypothetical protein NHX12_013328 [Muraenolepis orangiensis]
MDRMKIIKRRLSMSLRSARPVDETLSDLAEQINLEEPPAARDNAAGECVLKPQDSYVPPAGSWQDCSAPAFLRQYSGQTGRTALHRELERDRPYLSLHRTGSLVGEKEVVREKEVREKEVKRGGGEERRR